MFQTIKPFAICSKILQKVFPKNITQILGPPFLRYQKLSLMKKKTFKKQFLNFLFRKSFFFNFALKSFFNCLDDFTVYCVPILKYFAVRLGFPSPSNGLKQRENPEIVLRVIQRYPEYEIQDEIRKLNPPHTNLHTTPLILRIEIR